MQTAFRLSLSLPSTCALTGITFPGFGGAMPITDALVPLCQQCVCRDIVRIYVCLDLGKRPSKERVQLQQTGVVNFQRLEGAASTALGGPPSGDNRFHSKFFISTLRWLNLSKGTLKSKRLRAGVM